MTMRTAAGFALFLVIACAPLYGQGNYEIQVYGADTVPPGRTMVELHSNFTFEGFKTPFDGVLPDEHQLHETIEITQGWNEWFETGFYIFTSAGPRQGYKWVGDHIRPRIRVPDKWNWPVGVSLSTEFGYQRPIFSSDTWTWEIRPIIDKQWHSWYLSFNPALERSFHGPSVHEGVGFSPDFKVAYSLTRKPSAGRRDRRVDCARWVTSRGSPARRCSSVCGFGPPSAWRSTSPSHWS